MRFQAQVAGRLGRLEPEQTAADDGRLLHRTAVLDDPLQVLDGAIDENAFLVDPRQSRHERSRPGRHHDHVIGDFPAQGGANHPCGAIDLDDPIADVEGDAVLLVPLRWCQSELLGLAMFKVLGQIDAVVCRPGLFAKCDHLIIAITVKLDELFAKAMAHHAVTDYDNCFLSGACH